MRILPSGADTQFPQEPPNFDPEIVRQMIRLLPPSLKSLVENVEYIATVDTIMQCLQSKQIIHTTSDGGAIPGRASYMDGSSKSAGHPLQKGKVPHKATILAPFK
jgi:hypothetical protein